MKTIEKSNAGEESTGVRHVEQANESQNNNNVVKDTILFGSLLEQFNEHEITFLINQFNRNKTFGFRITIENLKFIEVDSVQRFLQQVKVGTFGQAFVDLINVKLSNN
jgi:hypothetical protein